MAAKRRYSGTLSRIRKTGQGKKALSLYRRFWGIEYPPTIKSRQIPGPKGKVRVLVGLGRCPALTFANGPKGRATKQRRVSVGGTLATDPAGRQLYVVGAKPLGSKQLGYVAVTEYIPTEGIEKAGSFKSGKHWVHKMGEEGGRWPRARQEHDGTIVFSGGTTKVGKWLRN